MSGNGKTRFSFFLYDNSLKKFHEIKDGTVCGRSEGELQFPDDDVVSRLQCQFKVVGNDIYVEDLNSTNSTKVNTVAIRANMKRRIQLNDVIEFGTQRLILTNQDNFAPGNIEDLDKKKYVYKGIRNSEGLMTSQNTSFTKRTRIILNRNTFHKMRLREIVVSEPQRSLRQPGGLLRKLIPFFLLALASAALFYQYYTPETITAAKRLLASVGSD